MTTAYLYLGKQTFSNSLVTIGPDPGFHYLIRHFLICFHNFLSLLLIFSYTVPLKCKLPPSQETRLVSLETRLVSLETRLVSLETRLISFESFLVSRECTGSTSALHCGNTKPTFEYNKVSITNLCFRFAFWVVRLRNDHRSILFFLQRPNLKLQSQTSYTSAYIGFHITVDVN